MWADLDWSQASNSSILFQCIRSSLIWLVILVTQATNQQQQKKLSSSNIFFVALQKWNLFIKIWTPNCTENNLASNFFFWEIVSYEINQAIPL